MSDRVSVIVPVFNGEAFLREALESAFAQTIRPLEVVVCDDGSTDATPDIARAFPVVYLRQDNAGVSAARNAAIARARGDHFALLDADDIWFPDKLAVQLAALAGDIGAFAVCHFRFLVSPGQPLPKWFRRADPSIPEAGYFAPSCWLVPRPVWDRVGPFRPELRTAEDLDWFARAGDAAIGRVVVPETLLLRRVHDKNLTAQVPSTAQSWLDTLRGSVARKRGRAAGLATPGSASRASTLAAPASPGPGARWAVSIVGQERPEVGPVLVSVIIPVYNGARFLGEALASVAAQHGVALEALVVDDGSDDGSAELAERWGPPIRCLRQRHAGIASARNAGIRAAAGELLAFLDADDVWTPGWLRVQADRLAGDPALDVVFGLVEHFRDADAPPGYGARAPLRAPGLLPGAMLIRRASFFRVGLFDETRPIGEFIDWQLRAQELGLRREIVPIVALRRRIHGANTTVRLAAERGEYVRVLRAALERRRAAGQA